MSPLTWRTSPDADRVLLVLGGLLPVAVTVRSTSWEVEGGDGRRLSGDCGSRGHGRVEALRALEDAIRRATTEIQAHLLDRG
jgi:hypothetical protein